jgi:hypothetical protein
LLVSKIKRADVADEVDFVFGVETPVRAVLKHLMKLVLLMCIFNVFHHLYISLFLFLFFFSFHIYVEFDVESVFVICCNYICCVYLKSIRGRYEVSPEHMPGNLGAEMPDENMTLRMIKAIYLGSEIHTHTSMYT